MKNEGKDLEASTSNDSNMKEERKAGFLKLPFYHNF